MTHQVTGQEKFAGFSDNRFQSGDLAWRSGEENLSADSQHFLDAVNTIPHIALEVFCTTQDRQVIVGFHRPMMKPQPVVEGGAKDDAARLDDMLGQQGKNSAG